MSDVSKSGALVAILLAWSCTHGRVEDFPSGNEGEGSGSQGTGKAGSTQVGIGGKGNNTGGSSTASGGSTSTGGSTTSSGGSTVSSGGSGGSTTKPPPEPGPLDATATSVEGPMIWKNGAQAAYTIIHDDTCAPEMKSHFLIAEPELTKRGLRAGFGTIAGMCAGAQEELRTLIGDRTPTIGPQWNELRTLLANGHELVNHSFSHVLDVEPAGFPAVEETRWKMEIDRGRDVLVENLGVGPEYFIFPFDEKTDAHLWYLSEKAYVGTRGGRRADWNEQGDGINNQNFPDPHRVDFAVFYRDKEPNNDLNGVIDDAINAGGWGLREVHGISDSGEGWEPVPVQKYKDHLDYAKAKGDAGALWMDGPGAVTRYRFARQHCPVPTAAGKALTFSAPGSECQKYAIALTYKVQVTTTATELVAIQGNTQLTTKNLGGGLFQVDADPTQGDVSLSGR